MRILLVDDEAELVSTLAERLSFRGFDADWASSGEDAIKQVAKKHYDVAILDIKIPKISGLALKKILQEKNPLLKFIFVTGHGSEEDYKAGSVAAGEQYYLIKPVELDRLIEKIKEVANS